MKGDAVKEVETTGWKPGAADEGARLESIFAVMKMVDYHVYHLRSHTSVCGSAISLVVAILVVAYSSLSPSSAS